MLMAAIIVVLGALALFRRPGPLLTGLYVAAGSLLALSSLGAVNSGTSLSYFGFGFGNQLPDEPLIGLGPAVLYLGIFVVITGGVAMYHSRHP
jgi:hypothetical protein